MTYLAALVGGYLAALLEQKPGNAESVARLLAGATPKERKLLGCKCGQQPGGMAGNGAAQGRYGGAFGDRR